MNNPIKSANQAFREGHYMQAEALYSAVVSENPCLKSVLDLNLNLSRKRIMQAPAREKWSASYFEPKPTFGILTSPHTRFIAETISERLDFYEFPNFISERELEAYEADFYFVLTPQFFKTLPPGEKRIVFQLEQSVSDRWFTRDYLDLLRHSFAVLDYSVDNIKYLKSREIIYPHVYYLPIGTSFRRFSFVNYADRHIDVLFYGDSLSSPRRRALLDALGRKFRVRLVNDLFGEEMRELIRHAKMVINLHYYEGALLETPRIMECISLGTPVLSETAHDKFGPTGLEPCVRFFKEGSVSEMLTAVSEMLSSPPEEALFATAIRREQRNFDFMLDRLLIGLDLLPVHAVDVAFPEIPVQTRYLCLSLPETIDRRERFLQYNLDRCHIFNGLRKRPGWIGCGLSYLSLARHLLGNAPEQLVVMEDDVELPNDFEEKIGSVLRYLNTRDSVWDVFAGLIASLHEDTKVLAVEEYEGMIFVTINRMTSTVCNIYHDRFVSVLEKWNPAVLDAERNTIDRYIENQMDLRVVTTLPFIVGHHEEVYSSLWNFKNTQYSEMIAASQALLENKVREFRQQCP
jgi:hypothetical protein